MSNLNLRIAIRRLTFVNFGRGHGLSLWLLQGDHHQLDGWALAFIHARDETSFARAAAILTRAYRLGDEPEVHPPVHDYIRAKIE